jgi:very-short-patch-repair endonuclease
METLGREVSGFDRNVRFTRPAGEGSAIGEQEVGLHQIVLYETVPGGAGYLERAVRELPEIARRMLDVFDGCGCVDSCYACLRSYSNQREHDLLDKRLVIPFLQQLALAVGPEAEVEGPAEVTTRRSQEMESRWRFEQERLSVDRTESPIEDQLLAAIRSSGLPEPTQQFEIYAPEGWLISRADFAYPDERVLIYCDGWQWHGEREAWERDLRQSNLLQRQGWLVLRFPGTRIFRDAEACAREIGHCVLERTPLAPAHGHPV